MKRIIFSVLAVGAVLVSVPAFAQEQMSISVNYSDINLTSAKGTLTFHRRLENAVQQICGQATPLDLTQGAAVEACRKDIWMRVAPMEQRTIAEAGQKTSLASAGNSAPRSE